MKKGNMLLENGMKSAIWNILRKYWLVLMWAFAGFGKEYSSQILLPLPRECLSFSSIFPTYVMLLSALTNVEKSLMTVNIGQFSEMSTRFALREDEADGWLYPYLFETTVRWQFKRLCIFCCTRWHLFISANCSWHVLKYCVRKK